MVMKTPKAEGGVISPCRPAAGFKDPLLMGRTAPVRPATIANRPVAVVRVSGANVCCAAVAAADDCIATDRLPFHSCHLSTDAGSGPTTGFR